MSLQSDVIGVLDAQIGKMKVVAEGQHKQPDGDVKAARILEVLIQAKTDITTLNEKGG